MLHSFPMGSRIRNLALSLALLDLSPEDSSRMEITKVTKGVRVPVCQRDVRCPFASSECLD